MFQSTHPHGVRHLVKVFPKLLLMFQSTHPHGVRLPLACLVPRQQQFQSTHPHGVRQSKVNLLRNRLSFNPRTHTGCDMFPCVSKSAP